jgi:hypothetical protein
MVALTILALNGCATDQKKLSQAQVQIDDLRAQVASLRAENQQLKVQLDDAARPASGYLSGYKLKFPEFGLGGPLWPREPLPPEANLAISAGTLHLHKQVGGWTVNGAGTQTIDAIETASPATKPATAK